MWVAQHVTYYYLITLSLTKIKQCQWQMYGWYMALVE